MAFFPATGKAPAAGGAAAHAACPHSRGLVDLTLTPAAELELMVGVAAPGGARTCGWQEPAWLSLPAGRGAHTCGLLTLTLTLAVEVELAVGVAALALATGQSPLGAELMLAVLRGSPTRHTRRAEPARHSCLPRLEG